MPPRRHFLPWILVGLVGLPYAWLVRHFWFVCDDAFISFRYARHWARGLGLRYNLGDHEPVEGYSNFLWVAWGALVERLGGDMTWWLPFSSALLGAGLLVLVFVCLRRWQLPMVAALPALLVPACFPPFAVWSSSGLETMALAFFLLLTLERALLRPGRPSAAGVFLGGLGLVLVRTEGPAWFLLVLVLAAFGRRLAGERWARPLVRALAGVSLCYALYFGLRYRYFGEPFANTVYAKVGFSGETLRAGYHYLALFVLTFLSPLATLLAVPAALAPTRRAHGLPLLLLAAAVYSYAAVVGGDFMAMGRLLVPAFALQALLWGLLLGTLARRPAGALLGLALSVGVVLLGLLPLRGRYLVSEATRREHHVRLNTEKFRNEVEQWRYMRDNTPMRRRTAEGLNQISKPGDTLVCGAIGVIGYYTELFLYDRYGLVTKEVARRDVVRANRSPGHQKSVRPEFFLERQPTFLYARYYETLRPAGVVARKVSRWKKSETKDLYVPELHFLSEGITETGYQFLLVHRRVREGESPARVWREFHEQLDRL